MTNIKLSRQNLVKKLSMAATVLPTTALAMTGAGLEQEKAKREVNSQVTRPNILFILSDDHTSQAWGIYGGVLAPYVKNDNIRRIAAEGVTLDNCMCTNSISSPSRASLLTGAYSHVNGLYTLSDSLAPEFDTIAKELQEGGYNTALFGKWHLKTQPQGYDKYSVFYDQGEYRDPTMIHSTEPWPGNRNFGERVRGFSTDIVTGMAIEWMKTVATEGTPFYLACHFKATHEPWDFPERMRHIYDGVEFPYPDNFYDQGMETNGRHFSGQPLEELARRWEVASKDPDKWWCRYPELPFRREGKEEMKDREQAYQKLIRDYLRCGATIDDNIGKLLKSLDDMGIADNTIVVYIADQGYFLGEHGFFDKRMMYEEPLHMPCVIRYPKEIPAGQRNNDIILNIDFASWLSDYAGTMVPKLSQGRSFRENLKGNTPKNWRKSMYYRYWTHHPNRPAHYGIRNENYTLIYLYGDKLNMTGSSNNSNIPSWEFYDIKKDPHQNHNLYDDPKYRKTINKMKKELIKLKEQYKDQDSRYPRMVELNKGYFWSE